MKYLDEYRDPATVKKLVRSIKSRVSRPWTIMEVCGGQTHAIVRYGLDQLLPEEITLVHGPGCPVCVTPAEILDQAQELALRPEITLCTFGDMIRVPGNHSDLRGTKARGGRVKVVYSPLDAVKWAAEHPDREVVFLAVGFETTAPANAMAVVQAQQLGLTNFSLLVSHVLVPPAMEAILSSPQCRVQAFLAAGHVCTVMGYWEYGPLVEKYQVPIVVTGFEPVDILHGVDMAVAQLEEGRAELENQYSRSVVEKGNESAQQLIEKVFEVVPRKWRGIGEIGGSGLALRKEYRDFDGFHKFGPAKTVEEKPSPCISGEILQGLVKPPDCPAFGKECTPETPLGATMVSSEGACAAYYRYGR